LTQSSDDLSRELKRYIAELISDTRRLSKASERDRLDAASLDRAEAAQIRRALAACDGNKSQAARLLQIDRRSLQRKLQRPAGKRGKKRR
jgi:ActR/RegA family two-component response regulator